LYNWILRGHLLVLLTILETSYLYAQQNIWVNEFHYDNTGTDVGEFVELGHNISLNGARLFLMGIPNPGDSTIPTTKAINLTGLLPSSTVNGTSYTVVDVSLPDGPAGFWLNYVGSRYFTVSYEGPLVALMETSTDVNVSESDARPIGFSLQKCPGMNQWTGPLISTRGGPNKNCPGVQPMTPAPTQAPVVVLAPVQPVPSVCRILMPEIVIFLCLFSNSLVFCGSTGRSLDQ
jgi:hypothetical protein